jgi:hypothetical protein
MKKFFTLYVISMMAIAVGAATAKAGTIAHWTFEEGTPGNIASGTNSIIDIAGGNNGTPNGGAGAPVYSSINSTFGTTGLNFNGSTSSVEVASGSAGALALGQPGPNRDFTIEVGLRTSVGGSNGFPVFYGDPQPGKDPYFILVEPNGNVTFHIYDGAGQQNLSSGAGGLANGTASTIAAVFDYDDDDGAITDGTTGDDNVMSLYINQTLVGSLNVGNDVPFYGDTNANLWFGSVHDNGGFLDGDISDIRISDVALSSEEQLQVSEPGMIALFGLGILGLGLARRKRI